MVGRGASAGVCRSALGDDALAPPGVAPRNGFCDQEWSRAQKSIAISTDIRKSSLLGFDPPDLDSGLSTRSQTKEKSRSRGPQISKESTDSAWWLVLPRSVAISWRA